MKGRFQSPSTNPQQPQRHDHITLTPRKLTEREAAEHCRYFDRGLKDPLGAFQKWARRKGIPVQWSGRARLYTVDVLEAFLNRERWTRRHATTVTKAQPERTRNIDARQNRTSSVAVGSR